MNNLFVYTDGGARHNPGPAAIGAVIKTESGEIIGEVSKKIGETTNNIAEYRAVIEALEWITSNTQISKYANKQINFFLDSLLVVNQLNGLFKIKDGELRNLMLKVRELEQVVGGNISYKLIPREKNWEADLLVNKALDNTY